MMVRSASRIAGLVLERGETIEQFGDEFAFLWGHGSWPFRDDPADVGSPRGNGMTAIGKISGERALRQDGRRRVAAHETRLSQRDPVARQHVRERFAGQEGVFALAQRRERIEPLQTPHRRSPDGT